MCVPWGRVVVSTSPFSTGGGGHVLQTLISGGRRTQSVSALLLVFFVILFPAFLLLFRGSPGKCGRKINNHFLKILFRIYENKANMM